MKPNRSVLGTDRVLLGRGSARVDEPAAHAIELSRRPLAKFRNPLSGMLAGSLSALEGRLPRRGWLAGLTAPDASGSVDRLRDVLSSDRALAAAQPRQAAPLPAKPPPTAARAAPSAPVIAPAPSPANEERPQVVQHEPIRTRTMARLLAVQGYRQRALAIYEELLAKPGADDSLRAEADALRARGAVPASGAGVT